MCDMEELLFRFFVSAALIGLRFMLRQFCPIGEGNLEGSKISFWRNKTRK